MTNNSNNSQCTRAPSIATGVGMFRWTNTCVSKALHSSAKPYIDHLSSEQPTRESDRTLQNKIYMHQRHDNASTRQYKDNKYNFALKEREGGREKDDLCDQGLPSPLPLRTVGRQQRQSIDRHVHRIDVPHWSDQGK